MTGPAAEVLRRRNDSDQAGSRSYYEDVEEDEPWDQQLLVNNSANSSRTSSIGEVLADSNKGSGNDDMMRPRVVSTEDEDDEEEEDLLDDGELPSLSRTSTPQGNRLVSANDMGGGRLVAGGRTTTRPMKAGSDNGRSPQEQRRKFWGQMEQDSSVDINPVPSYDSNTVSDDDGTDEPRTYYDTAPDDEIAARPIKLKPRRGRKDSYDESAGTESQSQLSDEMVEDEDDNTYGNTFCGQTLTAIGDMCGGGLNLTGSTNGADQAHSTRNHQSHLSGNKSPSHLQFHAVPEEQLEHTAIEVEFVEPVVPSQNKASMAVAEAAPMENTKKKAYLSAMAKKAKENFQMKKMGKKNNVKAANGGENEDRALGIPESRSEDEVHLNPNAEDDEEERKQADKGLDEESGEETEEAMYDAERSTNEHRTNERSKASTETEGLDDVYNSFSAAEKRMFIKFINNGMSASDATQEVQNARQSLEQNDSKNKARLLGFWKRNQQQHPSVAAAMPTVQEIPPAASAASAASSTFQDLDRDTESQYASPIEDLETPPSDENVAQPVSEDTGAAIPASTTEEEIAASEDQSATDGGRSETASESDSIPFKKKGNSYYDAVRRHQDDSIEQIDVQASTAPKETDSGKPSRFFHGSKGKGFSALDDSPERRSKSTPRYRQRMFAHQALEDSMESDNAGTLSVGEAYSDNQQHDGEDEGSGWTSANTVDNVFRRSDPSIRPATSYRNAYLDAIRKSASGDRDNDQPHPSVARTILSPPSGGSDMEPSTNPQARGREPNETESDEVKPDSSMDISMETYLNSAAGAYGGHAAPVSDAASVYTTGTTTTSYTQSSRTRRPGAAKVRLAKQKQIEESTAKKKQGWHETIKAAAQSANRVWDPKQGWIDYKEPESDTVDFDPPPERTDKIHLDLDRSVLSQKRLETEKEEIVPSGPAVPVSFPQEWEKEREEMIRSEKNVGVASSQFPALEGGEELKSAHVTPEREEEIFGPQFPDNSEEKTEISVNREALSAPPEIGEPYAKDLNSRPQGWVDSMRAASAAMAGGGKVWDPERGWSSVDQDGALVPDAVDFDVPDASATRAITAVDGHGVRANYDDDRGTASKDFSSGLPSSLPAFLAEDDNDSDYRSGSSAPLIDQPNEDFPANEPPMSPVVNVVKEKVDSMDMDLFPESGSKKGRDQHQTSPSDTNEVQDSNRTPPVISTKDIDQSQTPPTISSQGLSRRQSPAALARQGISHPGRSPDGTPHSGGVSIDSSAVSSRRGAGPVDMDEVDETWDSDDEERYSTAWSANSSRLDRSTGSVQAKTDASQESSTMSPLGGISSASKKIPKLQGSKRDTSPVSRRRSKSSTPIGHEAQDHDNSDTEEEAYDAADEAADDAAEDVSADEAAYGETAHAPGDENMPSASAPLSEGSVEPPVDRDESERPASTVKARMLDWRTRIEKSTSNDADDSVEEDTKPASGEQFAGAAGWKTFLGKKVQAESKAASRQASPQQRTEETVERDGVRPGDRSGAFPQRRGVEDEDTTFQFVDETRGASPLGKAREPNPPLNISDLSPIEASGDASGDLSVAETASTGLYGPTENERRSSSFLKRLSECAAPIMPNRAGPQPDASQYVPPGLCGATHDAKSDLDSVEQSGSSVNSERHKRRISMGDEKPRSTLNPVTSLEDDAVRVSTSSVVSEDFGAKTAYLDSIAMKAAVSKPKRSSSRRRERSSASSTAASSVVSASTDHSEKWKSFLERKRVTGASPVSSRMSDTDASRAAERYASDKVEEIMAKMASRSRTVARSRDVNREVGLEDIDNDGDVVRSDGRGRPNDRGESVQAAEDLAAARVEAMMAALSASQLDEAEI